MRGSWSTVLLALGLACAPSLARAGAAPADTSRAAPAGEFVPGPLVPSRDSLPLPPARVRAWQVGLLRADRLEHASLSFTLALGAGALTRRPALGASGALALGLAKEIRDRRHGGFDPVDLVADALGAGLGAWAAEALTR